MKVRLLADHVGPEINARAGDAVDLPEAQAEASIAAGVAEALPVEIFEPAPARSAPAGRREKAVKGPEEA